MSTAHALGVPMNQQHAHIAPLVAATSLDLSAWVLPFRDLPREAVERAATSLGARSPHTLMGELDWWIYATTSNPIRRGCLVGLLAVVGAVVTLGGLSSRAHPRSPDGSVSASFIAWSGVITAIAALYSAVLVHYGRKNRDVASPLLLRQRMAELANPGTAFATVDSSPAWLYQSAFGLERGDRNVWLTRQLRITNPSVDRFDFEVGLYHWETRHERKDNDGNIKVWFTEQSFSYLHMPLPWDISNNLNYDLLITRKGKRDISLSATFDRQFRLSTSNRTPDTRMRATMHFAPDVQTALLDHFTRRGFRLMIAGGQLFMSTPHLPDLVRGRAGSSLDRELTNLAIVLQQLFEQIHPAYKVRAVVR